MFIISVSLSRSFYITFLISSLVFLLLSSLNESQYDGKVIAGEEAVSEATIEPQKAHLRNSSIIAVRVKVNKALAPYNATDNRTFKQIGVICSGEMRKTP